MKPSQVATLTLRLLGIYCLIQFVPALAITFSAAPFLLSKESWSGLESIMVAFDVLWIVAQPAVGILLIVKSGAWGVKLAPVSDSESRNTAISFQQIQVLAFGVAGALIFASALPQLLNSISSLFVSISQLTHEHTIPGQAVYGWRVFLSALGTIAKAALGLWMFFGARGFVSLWNSLRESGTPKPAKESAL